MKPISKTRVFIIVAIALISIWLTAPTVGYYWHLRQQPEVIGSRPQGPEAPAEEVNRVAWAAENPELAAWYEKNQAYVAWERESEERRQKSIPLGLDLLGGVDVTLTIDEQKMVAAQVDEVMNKIAGALEDENIGVKAEAVPAQSAFRLTLESPEDARQAANTLEKALGDELEGDVSEQALRAGPVTISVKGESISRQIATSMTGTRDRLSERVNALGVTQPRISMQGTDQIRIQVPGEKDPNRLINTVIQPAQLEFRLVNVRSDELIGPDGKLTPGAKLPPGAEVIPIRRTRFNDATAQMETVEGQLVVDRTKYLVGADLRSANVDYVPGDLRNPIKVGLVFKPEGAQRFADLTTRYANQTPGRRLAVLLDGIARTDPELKVPILDGRAVIEGGFNNDEATELAQVLKAGSLPAPLIIESKRTVGASLGADAVGRGVKSLVLGTALVTVFMVAYYGTAGVIAIVALILNVLIILAIMALSHATLTLSGIGGILLTIGMAVDANVLIYERIREEVNAGRPMRQAIGLGFNRAFTVILDSNLTTLLTALVLLQFTEGSVFGFALTMTFGLLANLFTGLTVTYTLCALWFSWRGSLNVGKLAFRPTNIDFVSLRKFSIPISAGVLILSFIGVAATGGLRYGIDFQGGVRREIVFTEPVSIQEIRQAVTLPDARVVSVVDTPNMFIVDAGLEAAPEESELGDLQYTGGLLDSQLEAAFAGRFTQVAANEFGPETSQKFATLAITVMILASIAIGFYFWVRFELAFGLGAIVALFHDIIMVTLLCTLWNVQISLDSVAALLVLLGFSVNDTIVIFDRVREDARTQTGKSFGELCNLAMNQTLSRTIITSGTVFVASLSLLLVGGEGLASFAKIITAGTIIGTYSTGFIALPFVYEWNLRRGNRLQQALSAKKKRAEGAKPIGRPVRAAGAPRPGQPGR